MSLKVKVSLKMKLSTSFLVVICENPLLYKVYTNNIVFKCNLCA